MAKNCSASELVEEMTKEAVTQIPEITNQLNEPSKELMEKVNALKQLINIHDLLNQGNFPGHYNKRLGEGIDMVAALHKQLLEEAMEDKDAYLIPGLLKQNKGPTNG